MYTFLLPQLLLVRFDVEADWTYRFQLLTLQLVTLCLLAVAMVFGLYLFYFWDGWRQFGSRYTLDFTPFLMVALALRNDPRPHLRRWPWPALIATSIAINAWGIWYWKSFFG